MIDYDLFEFACPPRTGTVWFLEAARMAGLGRSDKQKARKPFPNEHGDKLRVTLVRHPCDWLASSYAQAVAGKLSAVPFDAFVRSWLQKNPGAVGMLYDQYEADTYLRLEDMPHALVELLQMTGVPDVLANRCKRLPRLNTSDNLPTWDRHLRRCVADSERRIMETYDYT